MATAIISAKAIDATSPMETVDPFLFLVFHRDDYPAGDANMHAPRVGDGSDFSKGPYRMYHGKHIPGFPKHPHRGFETVTATLTGLIDHADSCGNGGRYGQGDLQWMTAGRGIQHSEMFPLRNSDAPNHTRFFQIWLNLPARSKFVPPAFAMHWDSQVPRVMSPDGGAVARVFAGALYGARPQAPPPDSWAADERNEVAVWFLEMRPGARFMLPPTTAAAGTAVNRSVFFLGGELLRVAGRSFRDAHKILLRSSEPAELVNESATAAAEVLVLQGRPIGEPVAQHGPFVMNTSAEIRQAFEDFNETNFGSWPWPKSGHVFPREKERFCVVSGTETPAPSGSPPTHTAPQ
eukprot:gnl/Spiro4/2442_TR1172_c0_g1_i1.p1 gnl/Spiro4/2442_TR1172_c0_g1~~gnl/Spiro4/2442_TR1172_c0_g1_i1.p1  ORF type:complete len:371 (+),score=89.99 gnl/Spiro4/2442_TR1172_c0_g1_i1:68-1114(+)